MAVTECLPNSVEQILSIDERNGSRVGGLRGQMLPLKKITPPEALRHVERGANNMQIITNGIACCRACFGNNRARETCAGQGT